MQSIELGLPQKVILSPLIKEDDAWTLQDCHYALMPPEAKRSSPFMLKWFFSTSLAYRQM